MDPSLAGRVLFHGTRFDVVEVNQQTIGGSSVQRQVIRHPGAVIIVPLLDGDRVCLIRNERVAVGKTLIELPAGTLDHDEPPAATAARELREETGFVADRWQELPGFYMSPGILSERMFVFVAEGLTPGSTALETGENIENFIVPWDEAISMAESGQIEDAKSLCALFQWDRRRKAQSAS